MSLHVKAWRLTAERFALLRGRLLLESFIDVRFIQEPEQVGFIANLNSVKGR